MPVNTLKYLNVNISPFGGELIFSYELPDILPTEYKVYVFKKVGSVIQDSEIDAYLNEGTMPSESSILVELNSFNESILKEAIFYDGNVNNGIKYCYSAFVHDSVENERSVISKAEETPSPSLNVSINDGKDIVVKSIKKMLDNIYDEDNNKVQLGKHIKIVKDFVLDPPGSDYIEVVRVNGSTAHSFIGNEILLHKHSGDPNKAVMKGDIDTDVIRATFVSIGNSKRRDTVTNIFRAYKQVLIRACKTLNALDCKITIEGDTVNPNFKDINASGVNIIFTLLIENKMAITQENLKAILGELIVEKKNA